MNPQMYQPIYSHPKGQSKPLTENNKPLNKHSTPTYCNRQPHHQSSAFIEQQLLLPLNISKPSQDSYILQQSLHESPFQYHQLQKMYNNLYHHYQQQSGKLLLLEEQLDSERKTKQLLIQQNQQLMAYVSQNQSYTTVKGDQNNHLIKDLTQKYNQSRQLSVRQHQINKQLVKVVQECLNLIQKTLHQGQINQVQRNNKVNDKRSEQDLKMTERIKEFLSYVQKEIHQNELHLSLTHTSSHHSTSQPHDLYSQSHHASYSSQHQPTHQPAFHHQNLSHSKHQITINHLQKPSHKVKIHDLRLLNLKQNTSHHPDPLLEQIQAQRKNLQKNKYISQLLQNITQRSREQQTQRSIESDERLKQDKQRSQQLAEGENSQVRQYELMSDSVKECGLLQEKNNRVSFDNSRQKERTNNGNDKSYAYGQLHNNPTQTDKLSATHLLSTLLSIQQRFNHLQQSSQEQSVRNNNQKQLMVREITHLEDIIIRLREEILDMDSEIKVKNNKINTLTKQILTFTLSKLSNDQKTTQIAEMKVEVQKKEQQLAMVKTQLQKQVQKNNHLQKHINQKDLMIQQISQQLQSTKSPPIQTSIRDSHPPQLINQHHSLDLLRQTNQEKQPIPNQNSQTQFKLKPSDYQQQISNYQQQISNYQQQLYTYEQQLSTCEQQLSTYEQQLTIYQEQSLQSKRSIIYLQEQLNRVIQENLQYLEHKQTLQKQLSQSLHQIHSIQQTLQRSRQKETLLNQQLSEIKEQNNKLKFVNQKIIKDNTNKQKLRHKTLKPSRSTQQLQTIQTNTEWLLQSQKHYSLLINQKDSTIKELNDTISKLKDRLNEMEKKFTEEKLLKARQQDYIKQVQKEKNLIITKEKQQRQQIKANEQRIKELEQTIIRLEQVNKEIVKQKIQIQKDKNELKIELTLRNQQYQNLRVTNISLQSQKRELTLRHQQYQSLRVTNISLQSQIFHHKEQLKTIGQQLQQSSQKNHQLTLQLDKLRVLQEQKQTQFIKQISLMNNQIDKYHTKRQQQMSQHQQIIKQLTQDHANYRQEKQTEISQLESIIQEKISQLENKLVEEEKNYQQEIQRLLYTVDKLQQQNSTLISQINYKQYDPELNNEKIMVLESELAKLSAKLTQYQLMNQHHSISSSQKEINSNQQIYQKIESERLQLVSQNSQLQSQNNLLTDHLGDLQNLNQQLIKQNHTLNNKIQQIHSQQANLQEKLKLYQSHLLQKDKQILALLSTVQNMNLSSAKENKENPLVVDTQDQLKTIIQQKQQQVKLKQQMINQMQSHYTHQMQIMRQSLRQLQHQKHTEITHLQLAYQQLEQQNHLITNQYQENVQSLKKQLTEETSQLSSQCQQQVTFMKEVNLKARIKLAEQQDRIRTLQYNLKEFTHLLNEKDSTLQELIEQLQGKDHQLQSKDNLMRQKDHQLQLRDQQLLSKQNQLKSKDHLLESKDKQIQLKQHQLQSTKQQLQTLISKQTQLESTSFSYTKLQTQMKLKIQSLQRDMLINQQHHNKTLTALTKAIDQLQCQNMQIKTQNQQLASALQRQAEFNTQKFKFIAFQMKKDHLKLHTLTFNLQIHPKTQPIAQSQLNNHTNPSKYHNIFIPQEPQTITPKSTIIAQQNSTHTNQRYLNQQPSPRLTTESVVMKTDLDFFQIPQRKIKTQLSQMKDKNSSKLNLQEKQHQLQHQFNFEPILIQKSSSQSPINYHKQQLEIARKSFQPQSKFNYFQTKDMPYERPGSEFTPKQDYLNQYKMARRSMSNEDLKYPDIIPLTNKIKQSYQRNNPSNRNDFLMMKAQPEQRYLHLQLSQRQSQRQSHPNPYSLHLNTVLDPQRPHDYNSSFHRKQLNQPYQKSIQMQLLEASIQRKREQKQDLLRSIKSRQYKRY